MSMEGDWRTTVKNWTAEAPELFVKEEICRLGTRLRTGARAFSQDLVDRWPRHRTLIHGDFKTANLLFAPDVSSVSVVDWQWCGAGLGAMDFVYLLYTSCDLEVLENEEQYRRLYFDGVVGHLEALGKPCSDFTWEVFNEQCEMAALDYARFLVGSMWVKNTPQSCVALANSMNQGMHKRSVAHFVRLVGQVDAFLAKKERNVKTGAGDAIVVVNDDR